MKKNPSPFNWFIALIMFIALIVTIMFITHNDHYYSKEIV